MVFLNDDAMNIAEQQEQSYIPELPPRNQVPYNYPQSGMINQDQDFLKYRIKTDDILQELERKLKGEACIIDINGNSSWKKVYSRLVNDEGISMLLYVASQYVNRKSFLANLSKDEINFKCKALKKEIALLLFNKWKLYNVDKAKRSLIIRTILDSIHQSLSRSEDGKEGEELSRSTSREEIVHENKTDSTRSFMDRLPLPWNRGRTY